MMMSLYKQSETANYNLGQCKQGNFERNVKPIGNIRRSRYSPYEPFALSNRQNV